MPVRGRLGLPVTPGPAGSRSANDRLALRLWRLDRAATRAALRDLGVPVLRWEAGTELDSVLAWPLAWAPAWTCAVAGLGAAAVLAAAFLRWRRGPALAAAAAIACCAFATAGAAVLAAYAVHPPASAWLAVTGLAAAAYLIARPARAALTDREPRVRRREVILTRARRRGSPR
jgi:hypothetical protein